MHWLAFLQHWLAVHTGTANASSEWYAFWSGFGSDLGEVTIIGGIIAIYTHHKCSTCNRLGKHLAEDTGQKFCHHHWTKGHVDIARAEHKKKFPYHLAHQDNK